MDAQTYPPSICSSSDFPSDVLKWMKANAEAEMALKLMQVCKFFKHRQFPYLVLKGLSNAPDGSWWDYCPFNQDKVSVTETLDAFKDKSIWITKYFCLYQKVDPFSTILSKLAVCKAKHLYLDSQNLTIAEFRVLTDSAKLEFVNLYNTTITENNGEHITLEALLKLIPHVKFLSFDQTVPSIMSLADISDLHVSNMKLFEAHRLSETFNFQAFTEFMQGWNRCWSRQNTVKAKANSFNFKAHPHIQYRLTFDDGFPLSDEYDSQVEKYINKLITENSIEYPPPIIHYAGATPECVLDALHRRYTQKLYRESKLNQD